MNYLEKVPAQFFSVGWIRRAVRVVIHHFSVDYGTMCLIHPTQSQFMQQRLRLSQPKAWESSRNNNRILLLPLLIILTILSLAGCSWSSIDNDHSSYVKASLSEGKAAFKAKDYSAAYRELLPFAVKGNKDAQYAIGYMYYHGEGIDHNTDLAESWLQKAAKKGEKKSISLLKEIQECKKQPVVKNESEEE